LDLRIIQGGIAPLRQITQYNKDILNFIDTDDQFSIKNQQKLFTVLLFQDLEGIEEHRMGANKNYVLSDIILLTIADELCSAKGWKAINILEEA